MFASLIMTKNGRGDMAKAEKEYKIILLDLLASNWAIKVLFGAKRERAKAKW